MQQICTKRVYMTGLDRRFSGNYARTEIWPYETWHSHNTKSVLENKTHKSLGIWDTKRSPNLGLTTIPCDSQQKKRTCQIVDFDNRVKFEEREKRDKYRDFGSELENLWNIKVTVISIVMGALGTIPNGLVQGLEYLEIREQVATIQTIALRLSRTWRKSWRLEETWCHLNTSENPYAITGVKN